MAKSTHKQSSNNKKTHEEYRGIILSIIDGKYEININEIKRIVKPSGVFHMAGTTVERIICELMDEGKINFRKIGNEKCYYLSAAWVEEEKLEENLMNSVSEIKKYYENIQSQFDKLNLESKYSVVSNFEETERNLRSLPEEFFKAKSSTEQDEDKMLKQIKALVNQPSNKSKQKMLEDAQIKYDKIKKINEEILMLGKKLSSSDKNTLRDPNLLHKRIKCWEIRNKQLKQLADIEFSF